MSAPAPGQDRPRRLWVYPNRNFVGLCALLLAMGYAGASQTNAAAYLLGFTIASLTLVSGVHAWLNLRGLRVTIDPIPPVFAGEVLRLRVSVSSDSSNPSRGLKISAAGSSRRQLADVTFRNPQMIEVDLPATERGRYHSIRLEVSSVYPLGFLTARQRWELATTFYIYPAPAGGAPLPEAPASLGNASDGLQIEGDDFAGVRLYRIGESQRHIDWKAVARGQPLLTKQWTGDAAETLILDWDHTPAGGIELRLSQLSRWIVQAERQGHEYGLRIPGHEIPPGSGERHFHLCLRALTIFRLEEMP
ncbi:MAG: DUF58 domain-containing protein [Chthoniobacteraceae bacterium]